MGGTRSVDDVVQVVVPRLQDAVASEIRNLAQELAARADEVRVEAEAERARAVSEAREQALAERADAIAAAREQAALGVVSLLRNAVRRLDERTTLTGVLDTLTDLAGEVTGRAALFVLVGDGLQVWRVVGLDAPAGEEKPLLAAAEAGVVGRAIGERRSVAVTGDAGEGGGNGDDRPPAFAVLPRDRSGVAVPVLIGGEPLVAIYADEGPAGSGTDRACWIPIVEVLASHAGSRLEALAAERAAAFAREAVAPGS